MHIGLEASLLVDICVKRYNAWLEAIRRFGLLSVIDLITNAVTSKNFLACLSTSHALVLITESMKC